MSILTKEDLRALRGSQGIVPDEEDSIGEVWRDPQTAVGLQVTGGIGANAEGVPLSTASSTRPETGRILIGAYFCRVREVSQGREQDYGAQSTAVSQWNITFPVLKPGTATDELIEVQRSDVVRIQKALRTADTAYGVGATMQTATGSPYFYTCTHAGTTASSSPTFPRPAKGFDAGPWVARFSYKLGDTILVSGLRYRLTRAGTTGATRPTFPTTALGTVADGSATWQLCESVLDGTATWQVTGKLDEYQVVSVGNTGATYGVLLKVRVQKVTDQ